MSKALVKEAMERTTEEKVILREIEDVLHLMNGYKKEINTHISKIKEAEEGIGYCEKKLAALKAGKYEVVECEYTREGHSVKYLE